MSGRAAIYRLAVPVPRTRRAAYPHVVEVITQIMQSGCEEDFEFGLDLILDGLQGTLDQG